MSEPLSATQLIVVLERVAAETGLRVSQVMEVMQRISHHMTQVQAEAEFAAAAQVLWPQSTDRGAH